ncbi:MAG: XdhC family protein [Croceitalea sp.]|nr:XdhC family protein [Croceitalea sp.]
MTHELKKIFAAFETSITQDTKCVLATVVALEGSSYRRPGVRMLLLDDGKMVGAVSGGCVEKEVQRQAESVFKSQIAKVMVYDGRYRLGCEGILYILLEPFEPTTALQKAFKAAVAKRASIKIDSYFERAHGENGDYGSVFHFGGKSHILNPKNKPNSTLEVFEHELEACFRLFIIGAEHDAVQLCAFAAMAGWEVTVVADPKEEKTLADFPGALHLLNTDAEQLQLTIDQQSAVVLMTHSYVKDLKYLIALKEENPAYFGLLGPARRREKLFNELLERSPGITAEFLEGIHGPAGINVGAETPQEIAISIMAEILAVVNQTEPILLKTKEGSIHS